MDKEKRYPTGAQRTYRPEANQAAFPLGGIGTGNISLGPRGNLHNWEIFNTPAQNNDIPNTFFAIRVKPEGEKACVKVLEAAYRPPYTQRFIEAGLPRFRNSAMKGEYPLATVALEDDSVPVSVELEAFTPFVPLNADDSGIPVAIMRYKVKNTTDKQAEVMVVGSMVNVTGFKGFNPFLNIELDGKPRNEYRETETCKGVFYTNDALQPHLVNYGNLALMTTDPNATARPCWHTTRSRDGLQDFWDRFSKEGIVEDYPEDLTKVGGANRVGSLAIRRTLAPGEESIFEFFITWYFPTRTRYWNSHEHPKNNLVIKNHYASLFEDAWAAGEYTIKNLARLEKHTRDFHRALFSSTLPNYVLDAVASNITALRSNTCFRLEGGVFAAWEGCNANTGSCSGTCTHVWNYAQTVAFLFPELERSARRTELLLETDNDGFMTHRTNQIFGLPKFSLKPAADGQMGVIIRLYREWKLSGDGDFLCEVWDKAALALDFAFTHWDTDGDLLLDGCQHNTYDIDFYGPNSLTAILFLAALKAGAEMAAFVGDKAHQTKYENACKESLAQVEKRLWNSEFYIQELEDVNEYRYQYGQGCLSDQLLGELMASVAGLSPVLPKAHVQTALASIFKNNYCTALEDAPHVQRVFGLNDEQGLILCSWPNGGRPKLPFVYSDEVWTGVEYQVAAHLIYEDMVDEGLLIVKAVRDRYDGIKRNPWSEIECGGHYARSMASWAVLTALSGFRADLVKGEMAFDPKINATDFSCFWSTGKAWGIYRQQIDGNGKLTYAVETLYGSQDVTVFTAATQK